MLLLALLVALVLAPTADAAPSAAVTVSGESWARLNPQDPRPEEPPGARFVHRQVGIHWDGEVVRVRATWTVHSDRPTWVVAPLFGPGVHLGRVTWNGRPIQAAVAQGTQAMGQVDGTAVIVAEGILPADPTRGAVRIEVGPAASGDVRVQAPAGLVGTVRADGGVALDDRLVTGASALSLTVGPPVTRARDRGRLALATVGVGVTVGEAAIEGRARLTWTLRRGSLDRVSFVARGVGDDLRVSGAQVASWRRSGDRVEVVLREAETARVALDVIWTVALPEGEASSVPLPEILPADAFRTASSVQIARDAEIEVVPDLRGWEPISAYDLPEVGVGLVAGTPTAAFRSGAGPRPGVLALLRYVPADQPAVMVDVASHLVAVAADGRALARTLLTTRNERAPFLRIQVPPGQQVIAARVDGRPTNLVDDGAGLRVPLPRSLETLEGLLSFPVEIVTLGEIAPWSHREQRALRVLAVDAPVAVSRVSVHLPPGFRSGLPIGEAGVVDDFTEGETLAYGFGLGGGDEARADELWQQALQRYMRNEFDQADALLSELDALGATNENVGKLRANLDVLQGRGAEVDAAKDVQTRRVVAQAASRSLDDLREQEEARIGAEREYQAGNYEVAQEMYREVEELGKKLRKVEQAESVEQSRNVAVSQERRKAADKARESYEREIGAVAGGAGVVVDLEDAAIDGQRVQPSGSLVPGRGASAGEGSPGDLGGDEGWIGQDGAEYAEGGVVAGVVGATLGGAVGEERAPDPRLRPAAASSVDLDASTVATARAEPGRSTVSSRSAEPEPSIVATPPDEPSPLPITNGNTYIMDAEAPVDPVTGTFALNASNDAEEGAPPSRREPSQRPRSAAAERSSADRRAAPPATEAAPAGDEARERRPPIKVLQGRPGRRTHRATRSRARGDGGDGSRVSGRDELRPESQPATTDERASGDRATSPRRRPVDPDGLEHIFGPADEDRFDHLDDVDDEPAADPYAFEALQVTSTAESVVIPALGQTVHYQHLLLPAGAEHAVRIEARAPRSITRSLR